MWVTGGGRRLIAVLVAAAATAGVWATVLRGSDEAAEEAPEPRGVSKPIAALVEGLSAAERVDQVLLLGFDGAGAGAEIVAELRERDLGGVLLGPGNFADPDQLAALVRILRTVGLTRGGRGGDADRPRIPPLIVASQEGGRHRSFASLPPDEPALKIGDSGSVARTEEWARGSGAALRETGIDLNLFPVADVATLDSPVADRAFSDDPAIAAALTAAAVRGCQSAGIACAPLHFPGLGAASQDTTDGPATVSLAAGDLAARDVEAFRAAFGERTEAVVLSHALYAAYDPVTPASLSDRVATGLLRDELGFEGVAITDDLGAGAITAGGTVPEAAVVAIAAGADMVRIDAPSDQPGVREALIDAVAAGAIEPARLAEAAGRVLELKRSSDLLRVR